MRDCNDSVYVIIHADNKKKKEKHKYVAKIDFKKYTRYFYSLEEYREYLKNKKAKTKESIKKSLDNAVNSIKSIFNKVSKKRISEIQFTKKSTLLISKYIEKYGSEKISNIVAKKKPGYLYKEKTASGEYRYFYDEKSHKVWLEKQKYIANEPDFMKNIPKTKDMTDPNASVLLSEDNREATNKGWTDEEYKTNNCFFCTTAYELRQRGYDVVAKQTVEGTYGKEAYDIFKDPKIITFTKDVENNGEELKRQLVEQSGPDTRGNICVHFEPYGAHSMAYEISPDGKEVVIVDAQTNENYHLDYIASLISTKERPNKEDCSMFFRTDNLELKKEVLNLVQPANTKPKVVLGEQSSISDREIKNVIDVVSETMDDHEEYFDKNGNPTKHIKVVYPEWYDDAMIKVTWR